MDVRGRDPATESYVVDHDVNGQTVTALVPERLTVKGPLFGSRPSHQTAYVWMAANKDRIEAAIAQLARGAGRPRPPFDQITLVKER